MDELGTLKSSLEALTKSVEELARTVDHHQTAMDGAVKASSEALAAALQGSSKQLAQSMNIATSAEHRAAAAARGYERRLTYATWALVAVTGALFFVTIAHI